MSRFDTVFEIVVIVMVSGFALLVFYALGSRRGGGLSHDRESESSSSKGAKTSSKDERND